MNNPRPARSPPGVCLVVKKGSKIKGKSHRRDAHAGVTDPQHDPPVLAGRHHRQLPPIRPLHGLQGVVNKIPETLAEIDIVSKD